MPIYEFLCPKCKHLFERLYKMSNKKPPKCPKCKTNTYRIISRPNFKFKGDGWYNPDAT